jgi:hypothetical protein
MNIDVTLPIMLLVVILTILKVTGYLSLHWIWVFAPIGIPIILIMFFLCLWLFCAALLGMKIKITKNKK